MEQITYLLLMKLLDDIQLARESNANAFGTAVQDPQDINVVMLYNNEVGLDGIVTCDRRPEPGYYEAI